MQNVPRETLENLKIFFKKFFKDIDFEKVLGKLGILKEQYFEWNDKINISAIRDQNGFWDKHVFDSLCLAAYIHNNLKTYKYIYDIGSGGGFPGLVLSIVLDKKVYMVESKNKKCTVINEIIKKLSLNAGAVWKRYEEIKTIPSKSIITSRALGNVDLIQKHFKSISDNFIGIYMLTTKQIPDLPNTDATVLKDEYDFVFKNISKNLEQHLLYQFA